MTGGTEEVERILQDQATALETEKNDDVRLLEFGDILTLDQLNKELDVRNKIQSMIDRLFKRYWQGKAMKPLVGLDNSQSAKINETPLLELNPSDAPKM
jgi:hypothetical protein